MNIPAWMQEAGAHERPWWLKTNQEAGRTPVGWGRYELPIAAEEEPDSRGRGAGSGGREETKASGSGSGGSRRRGGGGSGSEGRRRAGTEASSHENRPPPTPATHMKQLAASVMRPLEVATCDEFHRYSYFPGSALQCKPGKLIREETCRGPEAKEGLGGGLLGRDKVYGSLESDYGKASADVQKGWKLEQIRRTNSEPGFGPKSHAINPSLNSKKVTTSLVGGTNISLKHSFPKSMLREEQRQVGLYEDTFANWRGCYKSPEHGLSQSDVTQFAGMAVMQKDLMRK